MGIRGRHLVKQTGLAACRGRGGGYGGLLAARVLSDHVGRISVLEQDPVTADTEYRSGVPQARHLHALLARGLRHPGAKVLDHGVGFICMDDTSPAIFQSARLLFR